MKWVRGKLILCGWVQLDCSNTTFIVSTIDRGKGPGQQRNFGQNIVRFSILVSRDVLMSKLVNKVEDHWMLEELKGSGC